MPALLDGRRMEMNNVKALVITTDWQKEDVISEISAENHSLLKIIGCDNIDKTVFGENQEYVLVTDSESKTSETVNRYLVNAGEYDEDQVKYGHPWDTINGKAVVMKADGSDITADDLFAVYARVIDPLDMRTCPICNGKSGKQYMHWTTDCQGVPFRHVCEDCYPAAMEKGYDGELYHEDEYED